MDGSAARRRHRDRRTASASQASPDLWVRIPGLDSYIERYPKRHLGNGTLWGSDPAHKETPGWSIGSSSATFQRSLLAKVLLLAYRNGSRTSGRWRRCGLDHARRRASRQPVVVQGRSLCSRGDLAP
jgi:hypothetical protein